VPPFTSVRLITFNFTGFTDADSGPLSYQWGIGSAPGLADVLPLMAYDGAPPGRICVHVVIRVHVEMHACGCMLACMHALIHACMHNQARVHAKCAFTCNRREMRSTPWASCMGAAGTFAPLPGNCWFGCPTRQARPRKHRLVPAA
jgi:hypothetical protein